MSDKVERYDLEMNAPSIDKHHAERMWQIMLDDTMPPTARDIAKALFETIKAYNTTVENLEYCRVRIVVPRNAHHNHHND